MGESIDPVVLWTLSAAGWAWAWQAARTSQRGQAERLLRDFRPVAGRGDALTLSTSRPDAVDRAEQRPHTALPSALPSALLMAHAAASVLYVWLPRDIPLSHCLVILAALSLHALFHGLWHGRGDAATRKHPAGHAPETQLIVEYRRRFNGRYIKDRDASESMDPLCDLMQITGIKRYALRFIVGSDVEFTGCGSFAFAAFSVVRWFKIKESYALDGTMSEHRRRDMRGGGMRGTAVLETAEDTLCSGATARRSPVVTVSNHFGGFRQGTLTERFTWPRDDVMEVLTTLENEFGRASFAQVFVRSGTSLPYLGYPDNA